MTVQDRRLGAILVTQGTISEGELADALRIQANLPDLRVGEILVGLGWIDFVTLQSALDQQTKDTRLGQILLRKQQITPSQLERALQEQQTMGVMLGMVVVALGFCAVDQVNDALVVQQGEGRLRDDHMREFQRLRARPRSPVA